MIMVTASAAALSAALLPFLAPPAAASWPYAAASAVFQIIYFLLVARTNQIADMSQAYPLMRGTAPLIVALVSEFQLGDVLSAAPPGPVSSESVWASSASHWAIKSTIARAYTLALLNALVIAGYTLIDGVGVRRSGSASGLIRSGYSC